MLLWCNWFLMTATRLYSNTRLGILKELSFLGQQARSARRPAFAGRSHCRQIIVRRFGGRRPGAQQIGGVVGVGKDSAARE